MTDTCPHFGICGGCDFQDKDYPAQLDYKNTYVRNLLSPFRPQQFNNIIASPDIWHYRNKMEFAVSGNFDKPIIGLRPRSSPKTVVDLADCPIFCRQYQRISVIFKEWITKFKIIPYNLYRHSGYLRYISMRHSKVNGDIMLVVVINAEGGYDPNDPGILWLAQRCSQEPDIRSLYLCLNDKLADNALTQDLYLVYGQPQIKEQINGIDYLIGPRTFFQTNSSCCQRLYQVIIDHVAQIKGDVLDLYCGCAGISLQVAKCASYVLGVDNVDQNIENACKNAQANNITNAEFVCTDSHEFLDKKQLTDSLNSFSCLIVDPPRAGLLKQACNIISRAAIKHCIYVSCNPLNLAQDLKILTKAYRLKDVTPVDMFPQTRQLEVVVTLQA